MKERIAVKASPSVAKVLLAATFILIGLNYGEEAIKSLLTGVSEIRESVTYQAILREGEQKGEQIGSVNEARKIILMQRRLRFGLPNKAIEEALHEITEIENLEKLTTKRLRVTSWKELLDASLLAQVRDSDANESRTIIDRV